MITVTDNDLARFAAKVEFPNDDPQNVDDCWFWRGAKHSKERGYGKFRLKIDGVSKVVNAHKAAYLMFRGEVKEGQVLGHQCNCETCCNPWHLEAQSQSENMQYCVACGRHNSQHH